MRLHCPFILLSTAALTAAELPLAADHASIAWNECGDQVFCSNLNVPLDWNSPEGPTVSLYVKKVLAKTEDCNQVIGSLFYSPGGPGLSGTDDAAQFVKTFGKALNERYDIVGLDPRSNGHSSPLNCDDSLADDEFTSGWPTTQFELNKLRRKNQHFARSCLLRSGNLAEHVDTLSVAKDLEAIRKALHAPKLNFIAISYATQIATAYLSLYPQNIGRIVMDVIGDDTTDLTTNFISAATAVERSFNRWADWCDRNTTCALHTSKPNTRRLWLDLLSNLDSGQLQFQHKKPNGKTIALTSDNLIRLTRSFFYTPNTGWPKLAQALHDLISNSNTTLLFSNFDPEDEYIKSLHEKNISYYGSTAVTCLDRNTNLNLSLSQFKHLRNLGSSIAPYTRGTSTPSTQNIKSCVGWPFPTRETRPLFNLSSHKDLPTVLLVQSKFDPSTLFENAKNLQKRIPNSRLLVRDGDGSLNYFVSNGVRKVVDEFLVEGKVPEDGLVVASQSLGDRYGAQMD